MFTSILLITGLLLSCVMAFLCLRKKGCNWFMISGYLTFPKEEKKKYKAKYDVVALNRYIAKMMYLPLMFWLIAMLPMVFNAPFIEDGWYVALIVISGMGALVSCFVAIPKILGSRFEKSPSEIGTEDYS